MPSTQEFLGHH